jgi:hypothetical protein
MLIYDVGSRYVYEKKGNKDNMPEEKSGILCNVKPVLQEISHLHGQFAPCFEFRGMSGADVQGQ